MSQKSRYSVRMHAALCAAFGLAVLVGSVGAAGAEDDADNAKGNWVRNLYRKLNARAGQPISNGEYERPPLVVPPTRELAPPGTPSTLQRSASWPVDRDEARRKAGGTTVRAERRPVQVANQGAIETPAVADQAKPVVSESSTASKFWNRFLGRRDAEMGVFSAEPPRVSLVDPPQGYRTPSPAEPYGLSNADTFSTMGRAPLRTGKPDDENR
jgi:hypothetical protein